MVVSVAVLTCELALQLVETHAGVNQRPAETGPVQRRLRLFQLLLIFPAKLLGLLGLAL